MAETVLAAVRTGKLWILTHPESGASVVRRAEAIASEDAVPPQVRDLGS